MDMLFTEDIVMEKNLTFAQRLALQVHSASTMTKGTSFPHGMEAYVKCAAKCINKKLYNDWR